MKLYPAYTQSNSFQQQLEFEVIGRDPLEKPTYQEKDVTQLSNYKNYIYQAQSSPYWSKSEFDGFHLPAQGIPKSYCLKWISWGCDNIKAHPHKKHYAEHTLKTCKIAHCPKCFEYWINRQANRSTRRLSKFLKGKKFNFRHIVLSPPQEEAKSMSYNQLKNWLSFALKVAKIKTCAVVFHPFRFQDSKKSMPYVSPHFHLLVYGKITDTPEFYNKTKWLIKNKGDMITEIDIFNCVRYMLSHAGVRKKTHVIRYLGDISYSKLKVEKEPQEHNCPYCKSLLRIFFIKKSSKSRPPPIDYVGLWEPDCFSPVNDIYPESECVNGLYIKPEVTIPFYELKENPKDDTDYEECLIYSFEEILSLKDRIPKIWKCQQSMSLLKYLSSIHCEKLDCYLS